MNETKVDKGVTPEQQADCKYLQIDYLLQEFPLLSVTDLCALLAISRSSLAYRRARKIPLTFEEAVTVYNWVAAQTRYQSQLCHEAAEALRDMFMPKP